MSLKEEILRKHIQDMQKINDAAREQTLELAAEQNAKILELNLARVKAAEKINPTKLLELLRGKTGLEKDAEGVG